MRGHPRGWRIEPSLPSHWPGCTITLRDGATVYEIEIVQSPEGSGELSVQLDGDPLPDRIIPRLRDDAVHRVLVTCAHRRRSAREAATPCLSL